MSLPANPTDEQRQENRAYKKAWYQRHKARLRDKDRARRASGEVVHTYKRDPGLRRDSNLKKRYGIDGRAHWEAIFDAQGRRCACCDSVDPGGRRGWVVDHDHKSPEPNYRGILCNPCNIAIGNAKECPSRLRSCADYLDQAHQRQQQEITYGEE